MVAKFGYSRLIREISMVRLWSWYVSSRQSDMLNELGYDYERLSKEISMGHMWDGASRIHKDSILEKFGSCHLANEIGVGRVWGWCDWVQQNSLRAPVLAHHSKNGYLGAIGSSRIPCGLSLIMLMLEMRLASKSCGLGVTTHRGMT